MPLHELANNSLLDVMTGSELVVYVRLLGMVKDQGSQRVKTINALLYRDGKTAARALASLEDMGLVKITTDTKGRDRYITVLER